MALAARRPVVVHEVVTAGHAFQKILVADRSLTGQSFRQFQGVVRRLHVVFGLSLLLRLPLPGHDLPSRHFQRLGPAPTQPYASAHHRRSKSRLSSRYSFCGAKTSRVIVPS